MADPPSSPDSNSDTGDDSGVGPDRGSTTGASLWVYVVFGTIAIGLVLLFVVLHLIGGGFGPGTHTP